MKFVFKAVMIVILMLAAFTYLNYLKTGKFSMPIALTKPELSMPKMAVPSLDGLGKEKNKIAFKWQDKNGNWQYSSKPPKEGVAYELIEALPATK